MLRTYLLYAAILWLAFAGAYGIWKWIAKRKRRTPFRRFAETVAGPASVSEALSASVTAHGEAVRAANAAPPPTDKELPAIVEAYLTDERTTNLVAYFRLRKNMTGAAPLLLEVLKNRPEVWTRRMKCTNGFSAAKSICNFVWEVDPRELGRGVGHRWNIGGYDSQECVICARASIGSTDLVPWVLEILNEPARPDGKASMRIDAVLEGCMRAIDDGWAAPELIHALTEWSRTNILSIAQFPYKPAVEFYVKQRPEDAIQLFTSPALLSAQNGRNLHFILDVLNNLYVNVPAATLTDIIARAAKTPKTSPWNFTRTSAINALMRSCPSEALAIAESLIHDEDSSSEMLKILREHHGIGSAWPPLGFELSQEDRLIVDHLQDAIEAFGEIGNGGLEQYFVNFTGNRWRRHITCMHAIGFEKGASTLERAAFLIDAQGASPNRKERVKQYLALSKENEQLLKQLNGTFWGANRCVAEFRYMLKHLDLFQRINAANLAADNRKN